MRPCLTPGCPNLIDPSLSPHLRCPSCRSARDRRPPSGPTYPSSHLSRPEPPGCAPDGTALGPDPDPSVSSHAGPSTGSSRALPPIRHHHSHKALYNSAAWQRLRLDVLAEEPVCCICNRAASEHVDHIRSVEEAPELALERTNVQGLCERCHSRKTMEERGFGRMSAGPATRKS